MKLPLTSLLILSIAFAAKGATVKGTVKNKNGSIIPYASVVVKNSGTGTTANSNGNFLLQLEPGTYTLVCQHVGFQSAEKLLKVGTADVEINFILEEQQYHLKDVEVKTGGEDPAYQIIRNAIKNRQKHLEEQQRFQCEVYIKGQLKLRDYPRKFMGVELDFEDGDTSKRKMLFLSETLAKYSVDGPGKNKIEVISTRVSGNSDGFGLASPQIVSFYENIISLGSGLNPRGFISPISQNALHYYRYKLEGSYFENGLEINHIKVIPRRSYEPLFHGYIDIVEGEWRIHNVQLTLLKTSQMQFLDTLKIEQVYFPVNGTSFIRQQLIYPAGKFLSFDFHGSFLQIYDKINLQPVFEKNFFNSTFMKVYDSANKKTSDYWDSIRPLPLLEEEESDYHRKDSLELVKKDPAYLDSLDKKSNKFSFTGFLFNGYHYSRRKADLNVSFPSVLEAVNYNTVEGAVLNLSATVQKRFKNTRRAWVLHPVLRYGVSNGRINPHLSGRYNFQSTFSSSLNFTLGNKVLQFNNAQPITPRLNTLSTLLWRNNYMKIYEAFTAGLEFSKGLGEGITISTAINFQDRRPLENTTNYSWREVAGKPFTPNFPIEIASENIPEHQALTATIQINWQPGTRYIEMPGRKINIGSKYPRFGLSFSQGVPGILSSDVEFTKWKFTVRDNLNFKMGGRFNYRLEAGGFLNNNRVFLPDYQHFQGNQLLVASPFLNSFQLMEYYGFSNTNKFYSTAHIEYHFNGLLTNKIPVFKRFNWFLVTGTNSLFISRNLYHAEAFVGIENIFKIFRVDYIHAFQKENALKGFRVSMPAFITGTRD